MSSHTRTNLAAGCTKEIQVVPARAIGTFETEVQEGSHHYTAWPRAQMAIQCGPAESDIYNQGLKRLRTHLAMKKGIMSAHGPCQKTTPGEEACGISMLRGSTVQAKRTSPA